MPSILTKMAAYAAVTASTNLSFIRAAEPAESSEPDKSESNVAVTDSEPTAQNPEPDSSSESKTNSTNSSDGTGGPSILSKYTFSFLKEVYSDGLTLSISESGAGERHLKHKVVRLGNLELNYKHIVEDLKSKEKLVELELFNSGGLGNGENTLGMDEDTKRNLYMSTQYEEKKRVQEKASKILQKHLGSGLMLFKEAPESVQYWNKEEREVDAKKRWDETVSSYVGKSSTDSNTESSEGKSESSSRLKPIISTESSSTGHFGKVWSNITIGDIWSFDGWHVAKSLSEKYPDVFILKTSADSESQTNVPSSHPSLLDPTYKSYYSNPEFVPEITTVTSENADSDPVTVSHHILGAASQIRRQQQYENLAKEMKEQFQGSENEDELDSALNLLDALNGKGGNKSKFAKENKKNKRKNKSKSSDSNGSKTSDNDSDEEDDEESGKNMWVLQLFIVSFTAILIGLYRSSRKIKWRPSKKYIERELKSL